MRNIQKNSELIKRLATEEGFARCGFAEPYPLGMHGYVDWLGRGYHASMHYLAKNLDLREYPQKLVENTKSVICLAVSYANDAWPAEAEFFIARYARGKDYHKVLKNRCRKLINHIRQEIQGFLGRAFVDCAPVMERALAARAGLGMTGRNGCVIIPGLGSYVFLCEIFCNIELEYGSAVSAICKGCGECVKACPTGALDKNGVIDCRKCISYLTIEHHGRIDDELKTKLGNRLFGCDNCQSVCPHNHDIPPGDSEFLGSQNGLASLKLREIVNWSPDDCDKTTCGTALRRAKYGMWIRNSQIVLDNQEKRNNNVSP